MMKATFQVTASSFLPVNSITNENELHPMWIQSVIVSSIKTNTSLMPRLQMAKR